MKNFSAFLFIVLLSASSIAFAHTGIHSSTPKNGDRLDVSPKTLKLVFNKVVRLIKVTIANSQGEKIKTNFIPSNSPSLVFDTDLPLLEESSYLVNWIALGGDGHKVKGKLSFVVELQKSSRMKNTDKKTLEAATY